MGLRSHTGPAPTEEPFPFESMTIEGSPELRQRIKALVLRYRKIFQRTVLTTPAIVTPMKLDVDENMWSRARRNKLAARPLTLEKGKELRRQVDALLQLGVIKRSNASSYSQVHLVPKPNGKWRFCIDYRFLNDSTEMEGGVIPMISALLHRLGEKRSRFFGVMDFTSGFHQTELSPESRKYTAFITNDGVYEWIRVPMGIKGAPTYFQRAIQTEVLHDIMYTLCELYIDDCITFGNTEDEYVDNLEQVLQRFHNHNIILNPDKCKFGVNEVEYVGYLIDATGKRFAPEKIEIAINFPLPTNITTVRGFVGMANYFSEHVQGMSDLLRPIRNVINRFNKENRLQWDDEATEAFYRVKQEIQKNQKLHFPTNTGTINVYTDASDYGIGGYIAQREPYSTKEYAIGYMSKALSEQERRWNTIEKECYAILRTLQKFDYLLRDIQFNLYTDHRNLIFLRTPPSPKVLRWKMSIQEYNFFIYHIDGDKNVVADAFSRLVDPIEDKHPVFATLRGNANQATNQQSLDEQKYRKIESVHNTQCGHMGVRSTVQRLRLQGERWKGMINDVDLFIKQCPTCQKMSTRTPKSNPIPYSNSSSKPWERLQIDTLTISTEGDNYGYKYILVIIDCFTRWTELYPLKTLEASEAAENVYHYFNTYGTPATLQSDQGTQFLNNILNELLTLSKVKHIINTAYSKEENGIVERVNKEVLRHVRAICHDRGVITAWSRIVPMVKRILNTSEHAATGYTPAELVFGPTNNLVQHFIEPEHVNADPEMPPLEYLSFQHSLHAKAVEIARSLLQRELEERQLAAGLPVEYLDDSHVLVDYPSPIIPVGAPIKLRTHKQGPFQIIGHEGHIYRVRNLRTLIETDVHVSRLTPFIYDPERIDPASIAYRDGDAFKVEKVIDFSNEGSRKDWKAKIHWAGYPDSEDSWISWKEAQPLAQMHKYLRDHKLESLIPKKYRNTISSISA